MKDANITFGERTDLKYQITTGKESHMDVFVDDVYVGFLFASIYHENGKPRLDHYSFRTGVAAADKFEGLGVHENLAQTQKALMEIMLDSNHESHGDIWKRIVDNWKTRAQDATNFVYQLTDQSEKGDVNARKHLPREQKKLDALNAVCDKYNGAQQER